MSDAVDDAMDQEGEDEEEVEGDRILKEVLDEIGISIGQQVRALLALFPPVAMLTAACSLVASSERRPWPSRLRPTAPCRHHGSP